MIEKGFLRLASLRPIRSLDQTAATFLGGERRRGAQPRKVATAYGCMTLGEKSIWPASIIITKPFRCAPKRQRAGSFPDLWKSAGYNWFQDSAPRRRAAELPSFCCLGAGIAAYPIALTECRTKNSPASGRGFCIDFSAGHRAPHKNFYFARQSMLCRAKQNFCEAL